MGDSISIWVAGTGRIPSIVMLAGALMLFVAGLLLLRAPASAQGTESRTRPPHFPGSRKGWIIGAQSHEPGFLAGG